MKQILGVACGFGVMWLGVALAFRLLENLATDGRPVWSTGAMLLISGVIVAVYWWLKLSNQTWFDVK